jgi:hypothetical protein
MRRTVLALAAAVLVAPLPALAQAPGNACDGAIRIENWRSVWQERGYWSGSVDIYSAAQQPVTVTVLAVGTGATNAPPVTINPGRMHRAWLYRTAQRMTEAEMRAGTRFTCSVG